MQPVLDRSLRDSARFIRIATELLCLGYSVRFRAHGTSMVPTIPDGELVTVAPLGPNAIRTGDVVLFRHRRGALAHRIIRVRRAGPTLALVARGDAALSCDAPIAPEEVIGRVVAVGTSGRVGARSLPVRMCSRALRGVLHAASAARVALGRLCTYRPGAST